MTHPSTHPHTYSPNHKPTHRWRSPDRPQICKQNSIISMSSRRIKFILFSGGPLGRLGVGWGEAGWCQPHTCINMHAHAHMYACTNTYVHTYPYMLIMINMAASVVVAICNFLTCSFWCYMHVHVCM